MSQEYINIPEEDRICLTEVIDELVQVRSARQFRI